MTRIRLALGALAIAPALAMQGADVAWKMKGTI